MTHGHNRKTRSAATVLNAAMLVVMALLCGHPAQAYDYNREWRNAGIEPQVIAGRGMTFNVFYMQDAVRPDWGGEFQPDATGNPGRTYAEQYKFAVGRALRRFADELVNAEPLEVVVSSWHHGENWAAVCFLEALDRPSVAGSRNSYGGFEIPGFSGMQAPPGVEPGLYPLPLMMAMTSRAEVGAHFPEVIFIPDLYIHDIVVTSDGRCGPETFWFGTGAPPPGRLSFEASVMQLVAAQLGWDITGRGHAWTRPDGTIFTTPVMNRLIRNVQTGQWMRDITGVEMHQWRYAEPAIQMVGPKLLERAKRMGAVPRDAVGVPIAAAPKRYIGFHKGLEWTGETFPTPRFEVFAASVAPHDALVDIMQPNPDWGIELTLAVLEDLGWTRYRAPELIPCAERADCLFSDGLER